MKNETNIKLFERKILKYRHRSINRKSQKLLEKILNPKTLLNDIPS